LELAGQDCTAAFEDIGHSQDSRVLLETMLVGELCKEDKKEVVKESVIPSLFNNGPNPDDAPGALELWVLRSIPIVLPILMGYIYIKYYIPQPPHQ
jgi:hypothetical protein